MDVAVLRWLGPWRFITFMGQLEGDRDYRQRAAVRHAHRAAAAAVAADRGQPHRAVVRRGRPCTWDDFWDLLIGNDNDQALEDQPGNQLAGFDVRWTWPGGAVPAAFYAQAIGEDEAGYLPSKYLGLFGVETWGEALRRIMAGARRIRRHGLRFRRHAAVRLRLREQHLHGRVSLPRPFAGSLH